MIYTLMNQKKAVLDLNYDEDFQAATESLPFIILPMLLCR